MVTTSAGMWCLDIELSPCEWEEFGALILRRLRGFLPIMTRKTPNSPLGASTEVWVEGVGTKKPSI